MAPRTTIIKERRLIWTDYTLDTLNDVVSILAIVNPHGYTADQIRAHVEREFDKGLDSYIGTGGWYVTVYRAPSQDDSTTEVWHALPTLMPFTIKRHLAEVAAREAEVTP